ncbi:hypothetical protein SERLA73DRAFT_139387 [Serpula lacrymans var. lacrymans S7.3]|uniref:Uncharacterized protein n=2 Tax=Serpula lacrymans var. lacrymans TaxID=341189 RepID=F8Q241_SERL3|nr:uncharacterized protein SERLADRAFT_393542 [Serpula lacrymans var. lacrymans S7.9]EGN97252.1 hypothetical protein SERLA73DRAFT_139387 [Serpula lacrymans var. lacrymans S7.3]EGO22852.1 hypothetical protein SERLADRAFT_393542 [Serpula lacrymans var. lacrymans S7.9]
MAQMSDSRILGGMCLWLAAIDVHAGITSSAYGFASRHETRQKVERRERMFNVREALALDELGREATITPAIHKPNGSWVLPCYELDRTGSDVIPPDQTQR